jgi:hypothetical protein
MALSKSARRRRWFYVALLLFIVALGGGWSGLWYYAVGKAQIEMDAWRAREAVAGRVYDCGAQSIGGFPFRFEVNCDKASALFRSNQPPLEIKTAGLLAAAQIYQPSLLISEFKGPLTVAAPGQPPSIIADWKLGQTSVHTTALSPDRVSLVFNSPVVDRVKGGQREAFLNAKRVELHARIVEGSATTNPVIEMVLRLTAGSGPGLHPAAVAPIDAEITGVLRGLSDLTPMPLPQRLRQIQAAGGRIDITAARIKQGETLATGIGALSLNNSGRLDGQLRVTVAGLEPFLNAIGAQKALQSSPDVDKVAGALDRLLPGLGGVAREQAGANISFGINALGKQTTLEGKPAVTLPLRFNDGAIFLGPIPIGKAPALF